MTASSGLQVATNRLLGQIQADEHCEALVADMTTQVAATNTTYNRNVFCRTANLITAGASRYTNGGNLYFYPDGVVPDPPDINLTVTQGKIDDFLASPNAYPLMINLESWALSDDAVYADGIRNLQLAASMWRDQTDLETVFWSLVPHYVFTDSINLGVAIGAANKANTAKYRARLSNRMISHTNKFAADLLPYADYVMPYTYGTDGYTVAQWKWFAAEQILEAIRVADGRKVYPIVWDHVMGVGFPALSEAHFIEMLKFVAAFPGIDGVYMWEGTEDRIATYEANVTDLITGDAEGDFPDPA